jgi:hypothetical protein
LPRLLRLVSTYVCFSYPCFRNFTEGVASVLRTDMNLFTDKRCPIWGLISDSDSQSYPPLEPQEDLQTWGHQLHHSVRFGDSSRTQKQSGPAPLDDSQDLQTVGNQPHRSVRLRDPFRTQTRRCPATLELQEDLQTVGNQPPHSVRLRDPFRTQTRGRPPDRWHPTAPLSPITGPISDSDATLSRYSGAPGRHPDRWQPTATLSPIRAVFIGMNGRHFFYPLSLL